MWDAISRLYRAVKNNYFHVHIYKDYKIFNVTNIISKKSDMYIYIYISAYYLFSEKNNAIS